MIRLGCNRVKLKLIEYILSYWIGCHKRLQLAPCPSNK